jgi:hypothetical protein
MQQQTYTEGLKVLSRLLGHHGKGKKPCPFCDKMDLLVIVSCIGRAWTTPRITSGLRLEQSKELRH